MSGQIAVASGGRVVPGREQIQPEPAHGAQAGRGSAPAHPGRSPFLDAAQLELLRGYGIQRAVESGEVLFAEGDDSYDLIVILSGSADIVEHLGQPDQNVII